MFFHAPGPRIRNARKKYPSIEKLFRVRIEEAEKETSLKEDPCRWVYHLYQGYCTSVKQKMVHEMNYDHPAYIFSRYGMNTVEADLSRPDNERFIPDIAIRMKIDDNVVFRDLLAPTLRMKISKKIMSELERLHLAGANLSEGISHSPEEYLPFFFKHGISLRTGAMNYFLWRGGAPETRLKLLYENSTLQLNRSDVHAIFKFDQFALVHYFLNIAMEMDLDKDLEVLEEFYAFLGRCQNYSRFIVDYPRLTFLEIHERLLRHGEDPDRAPSHTKLPLPHLILVFQYGAKGIADFTKYEEYQKIREETTCIHWCSLPPPWSIQRLLWIPYYCCKEGESLLALLPKELIKYILQFCGDHHLTFSERYRLKRTR